MNHEHEHDHDLHGACCGGGGDAFHAHSSLHMSSKAMQIILPLSVGLLILAFFVSWRWPEQAFMADIYALAVALMCGLPIVIGAIKEVAGGRAGLNLLVALAVVGAVGIGQYKTAGLVAFILQLAILVEELAERGATDAVAALRRLAPPTALVRRDGKESSIPADQLRVGDRVILRPGDRIPADGDLLIGQTSVDQSMISGEAVPVDRKIGEPLLAGTINLTGAVEMNVTRVGEDSALGNIIKLVRRAQQYQPEIIRLADRFFAYYTPIIAVVALTVLWFTGDPSRTIAMFLVGCACPILLSSPIAIGMALYRAGRAGILVKAGPFIEASAALRTVVLDKTGTLTTGKFFLRDVIPAEGFTDEDVLIYAASAERRSSHPLAKAIVAEAEKRNLALLEPETFSVVEGMGVRAKFSEHEVAIGSGKMLGDEAAEKALEAVPEEDRHSPTENIPAFVTLDDKLVGTVLLADELRPEAPAVCRQLRQLGIRRICLLTGDRASSAMHVAEAIGCNEMRAELLPDDKIAYVRELQEAGHSVAMVGDGINDAPSLTVADLGIAMGIRGTDVATEASDAVLLQDDLKRLPFLIALARATRRAIFQNLIFSVLFNTVAIVLAGFGIVGPITAGILHNLGGVVVFLNGFRLANFRWQFAPRSLLPPTRSVVEKTSQHSAVS